MTKQMAEPVARRPPAPAIPPKLRRYAIGSAAMAGCLLFTFLARLFFGAIPYPPQIVQDVLRTVMPGKLDQAAIRGLQHWAQRLLFIGVNVAVIAIGGYVATLFTAAQTAQRRARNALIVAGTLFVASSILALAGNEGASWPAFPVYALDAFVYARLASGTPMFRVLEPRVRTGEMPLDAIRRSRRSFLGRSAVIGGIAVLFGGALIKSLMRKTQKVSIVAADQPFVAPSPDSTFPTIPGMLPEITPNGDFYQVDIDSFLPPQIDSSSWSLTVGGLVNNPFTLDFTSLQKDFTTYELAHTLSCISNEVGGNLVSTTLWRGARLSDVLNKAGLKPGVVEIVFGAADGYSDSIPMSWINAQPESLIVFGMNGEALPSAHGFPCRVIVPGLYGMKQPKWLTSMSAVNHHYNGYWEVRGWDQQAVMVTQSQIDVPQGGATVAAPSYLAGIAWAGVRGIQQVDVSYDGGTTWTPTVLKRELSPVAWRLWAVPLPTSGGSARRVLVRATDGTGAVQTGVQQEPEPYA
ncbi:MAG: molybdopterin-dependent oxidoreductase, partial [Actinomycetota bacterium]